MRIGETDPDRYPAGDLQTVDAVAERSRVSDPDWDLASLPVVEVALVEHPRTSDRIEDSGGLVLECAEDEDRLALVPVEDATECGDLGGMNWQDVAVGIVDGAAGELQELVDQHAGGRCGNLAIGNLGEHLLLERLVVAASLGRHDCWDVDDAGGWQVGRVADHDEREVSELAIDRLLGAGDQLIGVAHVICCVEVSIAVAGERATEADAVVEHLDLHEKIEVVVRDRRAGQPPAALDRGEVLVQRLEPLRLRVFGEAEFIDDQRVNRTGEVFPLREHERQAVG